MRAKHRPDYFIYRGDRFFFHRIADGDTLARLDPYAAGEQTWPLHSRRTIQVTAEEIRDITSQVLGLQLPDTRPASDWDEARIHAIEERIAALETSSNLVERESVQKQPDPEDTDLVKSLRARISELESREPEIREVEKIVERVVTVSSEEAADVKIIPDEIAAMMDEGETFTPDVRRKLTERLNVELAELKNLRGLAGEDLKREAEIEKLLGLFARLGEI